MRSLEQRYDDIMARAKRIDHRTTRTEIIVIRQAIESLDGESERTTMPPERRRRLTESSRDAMTMLRRRLRALKFPLTIDPTPRKDRRRER
ncbi:hypothetical protein ACIP5Y_40680 [Nocardia sp. NPDC088792]|uniref:hypothetical protein n=1 Tax=Nocardia sp. NPDC088792 TaxID=3364332 RepID=UPI00382E8A04